MKLIPAGNKCLRPMACGLVAVLLGVLPVNGAAQAMTDQMPAVASQPQAADKPAVDTSQLPDAPGQPASTANSQPPASGTGQQLPVAPSPQLPFGGMKHQLDREQHSEVTVGKLPRNIVRDWAHITVSPLYLRAGDLKWILPLAGASAAAFATDTYTVTHVVSRNPGAPTVAPTSFNNANMTVSDGLRDGFIALPIAMAGIGIARDDERVRETGLLGSEALADAFAMNEIVKLCTFRERPLVDNGQGEFYIGKAGINSSFVSGHSMISWASAAVIAGEYHNKWVQTGVYTAAAGVSLTRVLGQQHFPTDVLIGAAGGWLIGHYVYRAHHHRVLAPEVR